MLTRLKLVVFFCLIPVLCPAVSNDTVKAVNHKAGTMVIGHDAQSEQSVKVDSITKITINGVPGKLAKIKPGMLVISIVLDGPTLSSIDLSSPKKHKN